MPSQAEIEQHQQDVQQVSALAAAEVAAVVLAVKGDDPGPTLLDAIPEVLSQFMALSADLAVEWYRGLARTPAEPQRSPAGTPEPAATLKPAGAPTFTGPTSRAALLDAAEFEPHPAEPPPREQLEATVRWALYQPPPAPEDQPEDETEPVQSDDQPEPEHDQPEPDVVDNEVPEPDLPDEDVSPAVFTEEPTEEQARIIARLDGATQRYVTDAARNTITENAAREKVRWRRHAQPDACAFCRMLATRDGDFLYRSKKSAQFVGASGRIRGSRKAGKKYHDDCGCVPVPVRAGDDYEPPDYVADWTSQYEKAVAVVGNRGNTVAILAAMRRLEAEQGGSTH